MTDKTTKQQLSDALARIKTLENDMKNTHRFIAHQLLMSAYNASIEGIPDHKSVLKNYPMIDNKKLSETSQQLNDLKTVINKAIEKQDYS